MQTICGIFGIQRKISFLPKNFETILKIDDDDDRNFNVLNVITKESLFHEINLKNGENIFVFSEKEILYIAKCTQIEAINIPKSIKGCFKFLFIKYYKVGAHDPFLGFLQPNMIIRTDKDTLDVSSDTCLKRDELYIIGNSTISQKSNGLKMSYEEKIELLTSKTSFVSLKKISKLKKIFESINEEYVYKVFSFLENIWGFIIFIGVLIGSTGYYVKYFRDNYTCCNPATDN